MTNVLATPALHQQPEIALSDLDRHAMGLLGELLEFEGYRQRYLALSRGALYVSDHRAAAATLLEMEPGDRALLALLALGQRVDATELAVPASTLGVLEACGLLRRKRGAL